MRARPRASIRRVEDYSHLSPRGRSLVARFRERVVGLVSDGAPARVLEVGCGQGWLLRDLAAALPGVRLTGIDLRADAIDFAKTLVPDAELVVGNAHTLPFPDHTFDVVVCSEVLEHVDDPTTVLAEIERVGRGHAVLSVPYEPWFWLANLARGKYLATFGNYPGHIHHWSRSRFERMLSEGGGKVVVVRSVPWLVASVERPRRD